MNAHIYNAALWCDDCTNQVKSRLDSEGKRPDDPNDERTYDSDDYPHGPYPDGGGEADSIQCCDGCYCLLENPLTTVGFNDAVNMALENIGRHPNHINQKFWKDALYLYPEIMEAVVETITEKLTKSPTLTGNS